MGGDPIRQLVLCERNFGWMDVWELNPEGLGSHWLMASATWWWGVNLAEGLHDWGRRAVPLLNYNLAFALQLRKSTLPTFVYYSGSQSLGRAPLGGARGV
jgi:hypothetical protein